MFKISRKQAEKLVGKRVFRDALRMAPTGYTGNLVLLPTGAKLNVENARQRPTKFNVYGYQHDNSDLIKAFQDKGMELPAVETRELATA